MRVIITTGEVNGMIENQNATAELGSFIGHRHGGQESQDDGNGDRGVWSCWASCTLSALEPTAANIAE